MNTIIINNFAVFLSDVDYVERVIEKKLKEPTASLHTPSSSTSSIKEQKPEKQEKKSSSPKKGEKEIITSEEQQLYQAAKKLFNAKDSKESEEIFIDLLQKYPDSKYKDDATYFLAEIMLNTNRLDNALMYYEKIIQDFSKSSRVDDAYYRIALIYSKALTNDISKQIIDKKEELKKARVDKDKASVTNIENDLKELRESLLQKKKDDYGNGIRYLSIMQQKFKNSSLIDESYILKGDIYQKLKKYDHAAAAYKTVADNYPGSGNIDEVYYHLGTIHKEIPAIRNLEKSAEYFKKVKKGSSYFNKAQEELKYLNENFLKYK